MSTEPITPIQACLCRLRAGDEQAREQARADLFDLCRERLLAMVRALLPKFARLRRWVESDDVLQDVQLRLHKALLREVRFLDGGQFLAAAGRHIRYQLVDLVRHYFGPHGAGRKHDTPAGPDAPRPEDGLPDAGGDPALLAEWTEVQSLIDELPDDLREVVDLRISQGLTWDEVSAALGVTPREAKGRLMAARIWLIRRLGRDLDTEFFAD